MKQRTTLGLLRTRGIARELQTPEQPSAQSIPDFSSEMVQYVEIVNSYDSSDAWNEKCDEWIDRVGVKLRLWNPYVARRFKTMSFVESYGGEFLLGEYIATHRKFVEIQTRYSRLQRIVFPEESVWLRFFTLFRM